MTRFAALLATAAVVVAAVAVVAAPVAGLAADGGPTIEQVGSPTESADSPTNESPEPPAPGARLAGIVAVHGEEVDGEMETRRFGIQVAAARSNASRAAVVADRVADLQARTTAVQDRRRALLEARENRTITRSRYEAETAALAARSRTIAEQANRTGAAAAGLAPGLLEQEGVDPAAIETLRTEARNLTGPEAAAIARSIAGSDAGRSLAGPPDARGGRPSDVPARNGSAGGSVTISIDTPEDRPADPPGRNTTGTDVPIDRDRDGDGPVTPSVPQTRGDRP